MNINDIKKIGVVGAGQMGSGIVHVAAQAGYSVVMQDIEERFLEGGMDKIRKGLGPCRQEGQDVRG